MVHALLEIIGPVTGVVALVGEGGPEGVGSGACGDASGTDGAGDSPLAATDCERAGVHRQVTSGEHVVPLPGCDCSGIGVGQGWKHRDGERGVGLGATAHLREAGVEAWKEAFLVGEAGDAVAVGLGIADGDEDMRTVAVLDASAQGCQEAQAAAVQEAGYQVGGAVQVGEDAPSRIVPEVGLDVGAVPSAAGVSMLVPVEVGLLGADGGAAQADGRAAAVGAFLC
ncbi:MAG: hypothetical protein KatS3mg058_0516 [Roseiflexus sp.]|nr:MAG: hypothetical protein KatS3mg058_0516 [Roseiflexus sp.]